MNPRSGCSYFFIGVLITASIFWIDTTDAVPEDGILKASSSISIDGEEELENISKTMGWNGNGSHDNPYIIKFLDFTRSQTSFCLIMKNTYSHVLIVDCTFQNSDNGSGPDPTGGILLDSCRNVIIEKNKFSNFSHGMRIEKSTYNVSIENNDFSGCAHGIFIHYECTKVQIYSNRVTSSQYDGIHLENVSNLAVKENEIASCRGNGIHLQNCRNCEFGYNTLNGNGRAGINVDNSYDNLFFSNRMYETGFLVKRTMHRSPNNVSTNNTLDGESIHFFSCENPESDEIPESGGQVIFEECTHFNLIGYNSTDTHAPVQLSYCKHVRIKNLTISGAIDVAIPLWNCESVLIENCIFMESENGIRSDDSYMIDYNRAIFIQDNTFMDMGGYAIRMTRAIGNKIQGNTFENISLEGVSMINSINSSVSSNLFIRCNTGVIFSKTINIRLFENGFLECQESLHGKSIIRFSLIHMNVFHLSVGYAVHLGNESHDNIIFNNIFSSNNGVNDTLDPERPQVKDEGRLNSWTHEEGYGNYWSDHNGPDHNGDGVVDTPYPVSENCSDNCPQTDLPFGHVSPPEETDVRSGNGFVHISWKKPTYNIDKGILGYRIYRKNGTGSPLLIADLPPEARVFNDTEVDNEDIYWYSLTAVTRFGDGAKSGPWKGAPDGIPPWIEILFPKEGSFLNVVHFDAIWNCSDNTSGIGSLSIKLDDLHWVGLDPSCTSFTFSTVMEGIHILKVKLIDRVGNIRTGVVNFFVDIDFPSVEIINPLPDSFLKGPDVNLTWRGSDPTSCIEKFDIRLDNGTWIPVGNKEFVTLTGLDMGQHWFNVRATDLAGNILVEGVGFSIDYVKPMVAIVEPLNGTFLNRRNVVIRWETSDIGSGKVTSSIYLNGNWYASDSNASEISIDNLEHGSYLIEVSAEDLAGNVDTHSVRFHVDLVCPTLISFEPVGENVPVESSIVFNLSEELNWENLMVLLYGMELNYSREGKVITCENELEYGRTYSISVVGWDLAGNEICDGTWTFSTDFTCTVRLNVLDKNGNPVPEALVSLGDGEVHLSDLNGVVEFTTKGGYQSILVTKKGYLDTTMELQLESGVLNKPDPVIMLKVEKEDEGFPFGILSIMIVLLFIIGVGGTLGFIIIRRSRSKKSGNGGERPDLFEEAERLRSEAALREINISAIEPEYKKYRFLIRSGNTEEAEEGIRHYNSILREYLVKR